MIPTTWVAAVAAAVVTAVPVVVVDTVLDSLARSTFLFFIF
jgi:hypothetical protein